MSRQMRLVCSAGAILCGMLAVQAAASASTILLIGGGTAGATAPTPGSVDSSLQTLLGTTAGVTKVDFLGDQTFVSAMSAAHIATIQSYDVVVIAGDTTSANFNGSTGQAGNVGGLSDSAEWNLITKPIILQNAKVAVSTGWNWFNSNTAATNFGGVSSSPNPGATIGVSLTASGTGSPYFTGVNAANIFQTLPGDTTNTSSRKVTNLINTGSATVGSGNGTLLANWGTGATASAALEYFPAGSATYGTGSTPAGNRLFAPIWGTGSSVQPVWADLTTDGQTMLVNEANQMIASVPEPISLGLAAVSSLFLLRRSKRTA